MSLTAQLHGLKKLDEAGGQEYLAEILDAIASPANIVHYVELVQVKYRQRRLIRACRTAEEECYQTDDLKPIAANLEHTCYDLLSDHQKGGPRLFSEINRENLKRFERLVQRKEPPGIPTGFTKLDQATGGLRKSDYIIIAARPSHGKTALALDIAFNILPKDDEIIILFSLEMSADDLWDRSISKQSRIPLKNIRTGFINHKDETVSVITASGDLDSTPLVIDATPGLTPTEMLSRTQNICNRLKKRPALVIVDYLQKVSPDRRENTREVEVSSISSRLKDMPKILGCPLIATAQLNREAEKRPVDKRRPQLSDLRESGAIEQDADLVLGLWRKGQYIRTDQHKHHAELTILKHRNGPVGSIDLSWDPDTTTFRNFAREENS